MTTAPAENLKKVLSPHGRVSFPNVFEPKAFEEGKPKKYDVTLIFPEGTDTMPLRKALMAAVTEKFGKNSKDWPIDLRPRAKDWKTYLSPNGKDGWPLRDGDLRGREEFEGCEFCKFAVSESRSFGLVNQARRPITSEDKSEFYGGCWAHVVAEAYAYQNKNNGAGGAAFELKAVQKVREDEPFSSSTPVDVDEEFEILEETGDYDQADDGMFT